MNITLTLNYIQQIDKRLAMLYYICIQIPCLPSDDLITLKMEKHSYSCPIVTRVCHTFVKLTYLFAARPDEWRHTADTLGQSPWRRNFAAIQLKRSITMENLST